MIIYICIIIYIYTHIPLKFHEYSPKNTWSFPSPRQHGARKPRSVRIHSLLLRSHGPAGKLAIASAICNIYVAIAVFGVLPLKPLFQQHPRHLLHKFNYQILKVYIYIHKTTAKDHYVICLYEVSLYSFNPLRKYPTFHGGVLPCKIRQAMWNQRSTPSPFTKGLYLLVVSPI